MCSILHLVANSVVAVIDTDQEPHSSASSVAGFANDRATSWITPNAAASTFERAHADLLSHRAIRMLTHFSIDTTSTELPASTPQPEGSPYFEVAFMGTLVFCLLIALLLCAFYCIICGADNSKNEKDVASERMTRGPALVRVKVQTGGSDPDSQQQVERIMVAPRWQEAESKLPTRPSYM